MKKKVAVLFSGGLDSTYLVWKNLKDGNDVRPIYVEIENNINKVILEKNRVELLYQEFCKEFPYNFDGGANIGNINYAVKVSVGTSESALYFKQMPIWLFALMYCQSLDVDEIQIGYVMNDDAISYLDDIQKMYDSYQPIFDTMKSLVFPLTKRSKHAMAHELPEQYLKLIVSCENPRIIGKETDTIIAYEPCGNCAPCSRIIESEYYGFNKFPDNYKKSVKRHHIWELLKLGYKVDDKEEEGEFDKIAKEPPCQLELDFEPREVEYEMECKPIVGVSHFEHTITITPSGSR